MKTAAPGSPSTSSGNQGRKATHSSSQSVVFTGHNAYLMSVARVCREANKFTDVTLVCPDGEVVGHRLVLAAASSTLKAAFLQVNSPTDDPATGQSDYTIIVPDVRKNIVASLVDFLYTGKLNISRSNCRDLQLLIRMLGIDPDNVRVEAVEESTRKRMVQSHLTASMGLMTNQSNPMPAKTALPEPAKTHQAKTNNTKLNATEPQVNGEVKLTPPSKMSNDLHASSEQSGGKALPSRAAKRRASQETSLNNGISAATPPAPKEQRLSSSSLTSPTGPLAPIGSGFVSGGGSGRRKPSRPPKPVKPGRQQSSAIGGGGGGSGKNAKNSSTSGSASAASAAAATAASPEPDLLSGYHDMSNVETWVCAICHLYDPAATDEPGGGDDGDTTEWIGCDCNRWYHKLCTGLAVVDETFCCAQVKLSCLPPTPTKK